MLKKKEMLFITNLRKNSRQSLKEIGIKTHVPISTLHDRLKRFNKNFILKNTIIIDFLKLGYNARVSVIVKVEQKEKAALREYLSENHNVNSMFRINNGFDFMFEIIFKELHEAENFLENLKNNYKITDMHVYYVLEVIKAEDFLSSENFIKFKYF